MASAFQPLIHPTSYRERRNIRELEKAYQAGNKKPLSDLLRAWKAIQELDAKELNSFFVIAGYHGEPFRGAGWGNPQWWGGYCNHGNVLFPTWHRAYLWRLENALRSIKGCEHVALPYWDETDQDTAENGLPAVFTSQTFVLDTGEAIKNPLYSYKFQQPVWDNLSFPPIISDGDNLNIENANPNYYKYPGYETVRYPFSGLTSESQKEQAKIDAYNASIKNLSPADITKALNENIQYWLVDPQHGTRQKYEQCLKAPNYTVFSNTTSAMEWNERNLNVRSWGESPVPTKTSPEAIVPLESPHNDMHLAVGGFNYPGLGDANTSDAKFALANGDMGENETASFDPIFFFHHCFIDKVFWDWQKAKNATKHFDIIADYPGTNSVDAQGPTPGVAGGTWLSMTSALDPFKKGDKPNGPAMTSKDVIDIESQLGYTYIDTAPPLRGAPIAPPQDVTHYAMVHGINRGAIGGSFLVATFKEDKGGKRSLLGYESILSRWHTSGCANCQNNQQVKTFVPLHGVLDEDLKEGSGVKIVPVIMPRLNSKGNMLVGGAETPTAKLGIIKTAAA